MIIGWMPLPLVFPFPYFKDLYVKRPGQWLALARIDDCSSRMRRVWSPGKLSLSLGQQLHKIWYWNEAKSAGLYVCCCRWPRSSFLESLLSSFRQFIRNCMKTGWSVKPTGPTLGGQIQSLSSARWEDPSRPTCLCLGCLPAPRGRPEVWNVDPTIVKYIQVWIIDL